jgi:CheY-like chemotaxis protein
MTSRILIADDHEDNRELICFMLREALYDIHEARDGHECLRMAREERPDLIMVDISMPRLDGWEVLKELRADQRTSRIPCVAVTAHAETDRRRALASGFDAYLSKPFRSDDLLEIVRRVLADQAVQIKAAQQPQ